MEIGQNAWDRDVYFGVFGENTVIESRGKTRITGDFIKGKKRRGPSKEHLGSSLARRERARDGNRRGEAGKVEGTPGECASMSPEVSRAKKRTLCGCHGENR